MKNQFQSSFIHVTWRDIRRNRTGPLSTDWEPWSNRGNNVPRARRVREKGFGGGQTSLCHGEISSPVVFVDSFVWLGGESGRLVADDDDVEVPPGNEGLQAFVKVLSQLCFEIPLLIRTSSTITWTTQTELLMKSFPGGFQAEFGHAETQSKWSFCAVRTCWNRLRSPVFGRRKM